MLIGIAWPALALADEFDRLEGEALAGVPGNPAAIRRDRLTIGEIGTLPNVLPGIRSAPIVVTTGRGNLARLLVTPAFRKPNPDDEANKEEMKKGDEAQGVPILSSWNDSTRSRRAGWPIDLGPGPDPLRRLPVRPRRRPGRARRAGGGHSVPGRGRAKREPGRAGRHQALCARQAPTGARRDRFGRTESGPDGRPAATSRGGTASSPTGSGRA